MACNPRTSSCILNSGYTSERYSASYSTFKLFAMLAAIVPATKGSILTREVSSEGAFRDR